LRDYADGLAFFPAEVEKEKGVVLSELRARDTTNARSGKETTRFLYAGTPVAEREVGGIPTQIEHATNDALRAFYRRCYRPERMTVIVIGELNPAKIAAQVATVFSSLAAAGDSPPEIDLHELEPHGPRGHVVVSPTSGTAASFFRDRCGAAFPGYGGGTVA